MRHLLLCACLLSGVVFANEAEPTDETTAQTVAVGVPNNPHDPNTPSLLELQMPNESELSAANTQLLAKNAELEHQVSVLTTQTNVLVQERSGQLFMYGAITAGVALLLGIFLGKLIFGRDRW